MRFSYDSSKLQPSSLETNEVTDDEMEYFAFADEFKDYLEFFTVHYWGEGDGIEAVAVFDPPAIETEHMKNKPGVGMVVDTTGGVLLGKMSFQMTADEFDVGWLKLETYDGQDPPTGIQINLDYNMSFIDQSTFRFTDGTASKDAALKNLVLSTGSNDDSTYKKIDLSPEFDKSKSKYEVKILENLDELDLTATLSDSKSKITMTIPKRNDQGKLSYDSGGDLIYEEISLVDGIPKGITLNKLGEEDTVLSITVTAEDGVTKNTYELVIKRPYGIIRGNIIYDTIEENENPDIDKTTALNFYKTGKFNWEELADLFGMIYDDPATYDDLDEIEIDQVEKSNADGSFEVYVIPGTYDLQIDKRGFLDYIITEITISEGEEIDLEDKLLIAGDVDRDRSNRTWRYSRTCKQNKHGRRRSRI